MKSSNATVVRLACGANAIYCTIEYFDYIFGEVMVFLVDPYYIKY